MKRNPSGSVLPDAPKGALPPKNPRGPKPPASLIPASGGNSPRDRDMVASGGASPGSVRSAVTTSALSRSSSRAALKSDEVKELTVKFSSDYVKCDRRFGSYYDELESFAKKPEFITEDTIPIKDFRNRTKFKLCGIGSNIANDSNAFRTLIHLFYQKPREIKVPGSTDEFVDLKRDKEVTKSKIKKFFKQLSKEVDGINSEEQLEDLLRYGESVAAKEDFHSKLSYFATYFLRQFISQNNETKNNLPFNFLKHAVKCEIALLAKQAASLRVPRVDVNMFNRTRITSGYSRTFEAVPSSVKAIENDFPLWHEEAQKIMDNECRFPILVCYKQITKVRDKKLNTAFASPAIRPFISKFGIRLDDADFANTDLTGEEKAEKDEEGKFLLSEDQLDALEAIDNALFQHQQERRTYGIKADIRIPTGGGKTFLTGVIEKKYGELFPAGITTLDLNSNPQIVTNLFNGSEELNGQLIMLDEAFFYGDYFLRIGQDSSTPEKDIQTQRNIAIRNLRKRGAHVIVLGASESLEKIDYEIERLKTKTEEAQKDLNTLEERIDVLEQAIQSFEDSVKIFEPRYLDYAFGAKDITYWNDSNEKSRTTKQKSFIKDVEQVIDVFQTNNISPGLVLSIAGDKTLEDILEAAKNLSGIVTNKESASASAKEAATFPVYAAFKRFKRIVENTEIKKLLSETKAQKERELSRLKESNEPECEPALKSALERRENKLEGKIRQHQSLAERRNEKTRSRLDRSDYKKLDPKTEFKSKDADLTDLPDDGAIKLQYVVPDFVLKEATQQRIARRCFNEKKADAIVFPWLNQDNDKLGCIVFTLSKDEKLQSQKFTSEQIQNGELTSISKVSRLFTFFDKRNAIGGDYGDCSAGITHQYIHVNKSDRLTWNRLMQYNRNRTAEVMMAESPMPGATAAARSAMVVQRKFLIDEDIRMDALIAKVYANTIEDDHAHSVGFQNAKREIPFKKKHLTTSTATAKRATDATDNDALDAHLPKGVTIPRLPLSTALPTTDATDNDALMAELFSNEGITDAPLPRAKGVAIPRLPLSTALPTAAAGGAGGPVKSERRSVPQPPPYSPPKTPPQRTAESIDPDEDDDFDIDAAYVPSRQQTAVPIKGSDYDKSLAEKYFPGSEKADNITWPQAHTLKLIEKIGEENLLKKAAGILSYFNGEINLAKFTSDLPEENSLVSPRFHSDAQDKINYVSDHFSFEHSEVFEKHFGTLREIPVSSRSLSSSDLTKNPNLLMLTCYACGEHIGQSFNYANEAKLSIYDNNIASNCDEIDKIIGNLNITSKTSDIPSDEDAFLAELEDLLSNTVPASSAVPLGHNKLQVVRPAQTRHN